MTTRPPATTSLLWQQAMADQQAGRLKTAHDLLAQLLELYPDDPAILSQLAALAVNTGAFPLALRWYERILSTTDEPSAALHQDIAHVLLQLNKGDMAIQHLQHATELAPKSAAAQEMLADTCMTLQHWDKAISAYEQVLVLSKSSTIFCKLGSVYFHQNEYEEAEDCFRRAISLDPADIHPWLNLGVLHQSRNQGELALADFDEALRRQPESADAHVNRGLVLQALGRLDDAAQAFRQVIRLQLDYPAAHMGLANILTAQGRYEEADASYLQAVTFYPGYADAWCNWGESLFARDLYDDAEHKYREALALQPNLVRAQFHLGLIYQDQDKLHDALKALQKTVALQPDLVLAHVKLAAVYHGLGRYGEERLAYRQAIKIDPACMMAHSGLLFAMSDDPTCSPADYLRQALIFGDAVKALAPPCQDWPALQHWQPGQRLRIGFVSGDLRRHPVGYFIEGLLANLDRSRFDLVAYTIYPLEDEVTARLKPYFSEWKPLTMMLVDDATAAQQIRDDGIHILIDLGGHTRFNRLATFARKPAPVQVSWLGYFATTGVPGMDYLLTDAISVPPQDLAHFTEDIVYLPETRLCFTQPAEDVNVAPLPASINGHITFGCFQNLRKINDKVLDLWARVLHAVPSSVLLIKNKQLEDPITRQNFVKQMAAAGIVRDRVIMEGQSSYRDYLEAYADVDLMLDTFPFPGGTTTCEALWMGVPTLTLTGDRMISLQGASMLSCVGLTDWIAADSDDYVAKATAKAADTAALAQLRAGLRARMAGSALVDAVRFSRHFESALEHMWLERRERLLARGG